MPLLDLFFAMLWFFLFVAWIWLLISVYADIFRSDDLGGAAKALWVVFVLVLPYLGVLIYLIARGGSMHERSQQRSIAAREAAEAYIRDVAAMPSTADELDKLARLRAEGVLSPEEFEVQKAKVLA
jgi:ABC-type multidrug transport system fused ATPase/permease subunit